ncbi:MAG: uracil-DNA glycosylase [Desulfobacterales bacterium]
MDTTIEIKMNNLERLVETIKKEKGAAFQIPNFDPLNGNENARILFLLEAPGKTAIKEGYVSLDVQDQTAKNFRQQLAEAEIDRSEIVIWNIVPWYIGREGKVIPPISTDVKEGLVYVDKLITILKNLEYIVLVGSSARKAHVHLSYTVTTKILGCHHTSPKVVNNHLGKVEENIRVFRILNRSRH